MDVKGRQVKGLMGSLGITEVQAKGLRADGFPTVAAVLAADEATLLKHGVKTKVLAKAAKVAQARGPEL